MSRAEFDLWAREAERLRDQALAAYEKAIDTETGQGIVDNLKQMLNQS